MKAAKLIKESREEIKKNISEIKAKIAESEKAGVILSDFGKYLYESRKENLKKLEQRLNATEDEFIYIFNGVVVNDVLPEMMRF